MTFSDITTPNWKMVGDMQKEIDELHRENALKLTQILDLEQILYATRVLNELDGSPCWCCMPAATMEKSGHEQFCLDARKATEPFWKK